jgi:purine catabolism regulator
MLTVGDIAALHGLGLEVAAGSRGLARGVTWLHVSELPDPTSWLEGGEFLLTTGLGVADDPAAQHAYVNRLADHGIAGLGFGLGFGFAAVPAALAEEADRLDFPVIAVPYDTPFVAITKAAVTRLASERLEQLTAALDVHEQLVRAVVGREGLERLLAIVAGELHCSLAVVDERGRLLGETHGGTQRRFDGGLELPIAAREERATLHAAGDGDGFGDYERLVLHHAQTALAFELALRGAVSAAELRLAGDLLDDLEAQRLDGRETSRRIAAFGLRPDARYAAVIAVPHDGFSGEGLRRGLAEELDRRSIRYVSTARPDRASFLVEAADEDEALAVAGELRAAWPDTRIGLGRPARGSALSQSLLEARTALAANTDGVASYRDLGSLELLLSLPAGALDAFVARVLGPVAGNEALVESLTALLATGCRWSEAADRLGVHRHTLRYRMERLRDLTGRHPDDPPQRMELWLALKAKEALSARQVELVS